VSYSVVIPLHNEGAHVEESVRSFLAALDPATRAELIEVVLVENGSRDDTLAVIRAMAARDSIITAITIPRGSYGEAIRAGMLAARGTWLSILEVDFLDAEFARASLQMLKHGASRFIVASKRAAGSVDERPLHRRIITAGFNAVLRGFIGYDGTDTHGLKSIETALAKELCELAVTTDEALQTEIVLIAARRGCRIAELPIAIREVRPAPIRVLHRIPKTFGILMDLRRSLRRFPRQPS
jgi:glycosyltransferase involved in cell wall biosynthesis